MLKYKTNDATKLYMLADFDRVLGLDLIKKGNAKREELKKQTADTTTLIVAQRISTILHADQIIVLDDGKIAGVGTSEELLKTNDIYREVYESQVKGGGDDE